MTDGTPDAEFAAALALARAGEVPAAKLGFARAAEQGHVDAMLLLADLGVRGPGVPADPALAVHWYERAVAAGVPAAARALAALHRTGHCLPVDDALARTWFQRAIAMGHVPAIRDLGLLLWVAGPERRAEASAVLRHAARAGDAYTLRQLTELDGVMAPGVSAAEDAATLARVSAAFDWPVWPGPDPARTVVRTGSVTTHADLLDPVHCTYLMTTASPWLDRSRTSDPATGRPVPDQARTSWGMNFAQAFPDLVVADAERRIAAFAGLALSHAEPLAVLRYEVGQEYRPHFDYLAPGALATHPFYARGGQRTLTVVTYLNRPAAGGGTEFPQLGLRVEPEPGTGLRFRNVRPDGSPDPDSLHAGLPVTAGEKWVATLWFRERPTRDHGG
jgi:prolyl 4-hydroxylase